MLSSNTCDVVVTQSSGGGWRDAGCCDAGCCDCGGLLSAASMACSCADEVGIILLLLPVLEPAWRETTTLRSVGAESFAGELAVAAAVDRGGASLPSLLMLQSQWVTNDLEKGPLKGVEEG